MKETSLLLIGGMKKEKAEKVMQTMKEELREREIDADITFVNLFETSDFAEYESNCDLAVHAGTGGLEISLPVVNGLGLLYPYMGTEPIYDEIVKTVSEK